MQRAMHMVLKLLFFLRNGAETAVETELGVSQSLC
jgi:hypothetical protein